MFQSLELKKINKKNPDNLFTALRKPVFMLLKRT